MSSPLQQLLDLQEIDLQIDQARHRRSHLPELDELVDIDRAGSDANREMVAAEAAAAEVGSRQAAAEAELAATEERIAAIDKRLYSGEVSASRELQSMAAEADHLRRRASGLEDVVLGLIDEKEPFEASVMSRRDALATLAARRAEVAARVAEASGCIDAELADLEQRRQEAAAAVPEDLLATYERLRARLGGIGVAKLVGTRCDGCHLTLSAVELDRVRHLGEGELYTCEQCSRILVP